MQTFIERARQALHVGPDAFLPSSLEAQELTLKELDIYEEGVKRLVKTVERFQGDTREFLEAAAAYATRTPSPRVWVQGSSTEAATPSPTHVPAEHAALFDAGVGGQLAESVPAGVSYAFERELLGPLTQWLLAYEVARGFLADVQGKRLGYDAARRALVNRANRTTEAVVGKGASPGDQRLVQLAEDAAAASATLAAFESDVEVLDDLLLWLVGGAARLKALLADAAGGIGAAAEAWQVPPGLLPPFPDKSMIGEDLEVTMTLTDTASAVDVLVHGTPAGTAGAATLGGGGSSSSSAGTQEQSDDGTAFSPAAPEVASRPARSYSGEGTGQLESRLPDEAAHGLGSGQRRLGRTRSSEAEGAAVLLLADDEPVEDAAHKQLSTVVLAEPEAVEVLSKSTTTAPAPRAAAAAESTPVTPPVTADDADMFGVQGAAASSSSSGADAAAAPEAEPDSGAAPGGLWTGIKSAIAEAASAVTHSSSAAGDEGAQETGDSAGVQGDMHIGPVPPSGAAPPPEPGSAVWVKGATPPGGAAAESPAGSDEPGVPAR